MAAFTVTRRAERGEKPKHLRKQGLVPMALVTRDHTTESIKASVADLQAAVRSADSHGVIEIQIEGEGGVRKAMLKSVAGDPLARQVLSATFQEVAEGDVVKVDVPVVASGHNDDNDGAGVVLTAVTTEIKVRGQVSSLPESITVDVSHLSAGEHVSAGDVALPDGVELVTSPDAVLFAVANVPAPVLSESEVVTEPDGTVSAES